MSDIIGQLSVSDTPRPWPCLGLLVPRPDRGPVIALISREVTTADVDPGCRFQDGVSLLVLLRDPDLLPGLGLEMLRSIFGLTHAESAIVADVVSGHRVPQIAERRGVAIDTVRCQLKAARSKIGVSCQASLVSRVLRAMPA